MKNSVSLIAVLAILPQLAFAQAASPFLTGATSLQSNILAWLTPIAIILVMALGAMAMANRMLQNLKTKVLLGCADPDTARYFSDVIGEERVLRRKKTTTPGRDLSETRRVSTSWEPEMHRLVTYSEIMCLPVRRGYLRLPDGCVHPIKVGLTRLRPTLPAFVDR